MAGLTRIAIALGAAALAVAPAQAQQVGPNAPARVGSPQRAALLNTLRPAVEQELGAPIEFVVNCIRVTDGWATIGADPQRRGGRPIPRAITRRYPEGVFVSAVLRFRQGRWHLVEHAVGATDVWYVDMVPPAAVDGPCS